MPLSLILQEHNIYLSLKKHTGEKMNHKKFDPAKLKKLNDPQRLEDIPPDFIADKLNLESHGVLVEIGAGTAFFSIAFFRQLKPSTVYACDYSDVMINWITENVSPRYPGIIPVKNAESSVPLDNGISDLVFMIALHHELENPLLMLEESFRILKPGGKIFIVDWKKIDMPEGPPTEIRYIPEKVREQMIEAGFKSIFIYDDLPKHFLVVGEKEP